jgi:hypothetical protein
MSTTTDTGRAESGQDRFDPLLDRLESVIHRLDLAADDLSDLAEKRLPDIEAHGSAAFVVREVVEELRHLYYDLDTWDSEYDYTPRDPQLIERLHRLSEEATESNSQDQP